MRNFRFAVAVLLMLVMPIQGYAMAAMAMHGPAQAGARQSSESAPGRNVDHHAMHHHSADGDAHHHPAPPAGSADCDKCGACALCGGILTSPELHFALDTALPQNPQGLLPEPAAIYLDPPSQVPRSSAA